MFVTVPESLFGEMVREAAGGAVGGLLYGSIRDDGDVFQIVTTAAVEDQTVIGRWRLTGDIHAQPEAVDGTEMLLAYNPVDAGLQSWLSLNGQWVPVHFTVVRLIADYSKRIAGLLDVDLLSGRRVAVIGLGTGGGRVALELAKLGVGQLRLVDFDRLEVHNIVRHVCGLSDIGRLKTLAVRDRLRDTAPRLDIQTFPVDILLRPDVLEDVIRGCDLVVAATDSEASKAAINAACFRAGIPSVYGAAYNRAFGGEVFVALPGETACYQCLQMLTADMFAGDPPAALPEDLPYEDPERLKELIAEPGLGLDVDMISLILAQAVLRLLVRGTTSRLVAYPGNWILWGNRQEWLFDKPLDSKFVEIPRHEECPVCNRAAWTRKNLGLSEEQADAAGWDILDQIPSRSPFDGAAAQHDRDQA